MKHSLWENTQLHQQGSWQCACPLHRLFLKVEIDEIIQLLALAPIAVLNPVLSRVVHIQNAPVSKHLDDNGLCFPNI